ncbi:MAG TPA: hypothetical protein VME46_12040 [Acidimicrobiales bacterium]|nr:hypothetical protein [Acidimicrobiales bacterium]
MGKRLFILLPTPVQRACSGDGAQHNFECLHMERSTEGRLAVSFGRAGEAGAAMAPMFVPPRRAD